MESSYKILHNDHHASPMPSLRASHDDTIFQVHLIAVNKAKSVTDLRQFSLSYMERLLRIGAAILILFSILDTLTLFYFYDYKPQKYVPGVYFICGLIGLVLLNKIALKISFYMQIYLVLMNCYLFYEEFEDMIDKNLSITWISTLIMIEYGTFAILGVLIAYRFNKVIKTYDFIDTRTSDI